MRKFVRMFTALHLESRFPQADCGASADAAAGSRHQCDLHN
jgi:hypothetical protein